MAVFTLDDCRFGLPIPVNFYVLPMGCTKVPHLLVQIKLLSARTCAASDLSSNKPGRIIQPITAACKIPMHTLQTQARCGSLPSVLQTGSGEGAKLQHHTYGSGCNATGHRLLCSAARKHRPHQLLRLNAPVSKVPLCFACDLFREIMCHNKRT